MPDLTLPPSADVVLGVVGFVVVAGFIALAWLRRGRDPKVVDDASILMPAPPPAMTAATAAIVSGGGGRLAFIAALLDLATRDEIAFVAEGREHGADQLGIAFRGGETTDPQVRLNRRLPIGEAETWLLAELKAFRSIETSGAGHREGDAPPPEAIAAGMQMLTTMMRIGATTADDDDSFEARSAREHGLTATSMPDAAALEAAYEQRTGHAMPEKSREGIERLTSTMSAFADPSAIMKDPEAFAERMAAQNGHTLTDDERAQVRAWAATYATSPAAGAARATASAEASYIPAARARSVQAPFLFGTLIQTYATRHGWMAELPLRARLHWYWVAIREAGVGAVLAIIGSAFDVEPLVWLGGGVLLGALVTAIAAPSMAALSPLGASMRAQVAAYRRTLQATIAQSGSLDEARTASRLTWLETPDQTLVWSFALGLQRDIERLLGGQGTAASGIARYVPAWYRLAGSSRGSARRGPCHGWRSGPAGRRRGDVRGDRGDRQRHDPLVAQTAAVRTPAGSR